MRSMKKIAILLTLLFNNIALAGVIQNGDFATCDYSSWETFTDNTTSSPNDFFINNNGASCSAEVQVDHFSTAGDPFSDAVNDAWFNNSLLHALDFTGVADSTWLLSIDFSVNSEINSNNNPGFIADFYNFALTNGTGIYFDKDQNEDFLVGITEINGLAAQSITLELSNLFTNTAGWFLDMQLSLGADQSGWTDAYGSSLFVNQVSLVEKLSSTTAVPEPSTLIIFVLALIGLVIRKKQHL